MSQGVFRLCDDCGEEWTTSEEEAELTCSHREWVKKACPGWPQEEDAARKRVESPVMSMAICWCPPGCLHGKVEEEEE